MIIKKCKICGAFLKGRQTLYCSKKCINASVSKKAILGQKFNGRHIELLKFKDKIAREFSADFRCRLKESIVVKKMFMYIAYFHMKYNVCDIAKVLNLDHSTVSQTLKGLPEDIKTKGDNYILKGKRLPLIKEKTEFEKNVERLGFRYNMC